MMAKDGEFISYVQGSFKYSSLRLLRFNRFLRLRKVFGNTDNNFLSCFLQFLDYDGKSLAYAKMELKQQQS